MKKEFVSYEIALAVRELGFNEPCFTSYDSEGNLRNPFDYSNSEYNDNRTYIEDTKNLVYNSELTIENFNGPKQLYTMFIAAPLYQQAFRWFREKHNIDGFVQIEPLNELYGFVVYNRNHNRFIEYDRNLSIEQAQLECLKKLIQSVKNKKYEL